jgi:hypothetical protein
METKSRSQNLREQKLINEGLEKILKEKQEELMLKQEELKQEELKQEELMLKQELLDEQGQGQGIIRFIENAKPRQRQRRPGYSLPNEQQKKKPSEQQQEIIKIWEEMQNQERERERVGNIQQVQVLGIDDEIHKFLNYIYRFKIKFIDAISRYLNLNRDSLPEKKLVKNFIKIWLTDYDKYLITNYFEKNMTGVSDEIKDELVDFIDIQCSPDFQQINIKEVFEKYKVFKKNKISNRFTEFNKFLNNICVQKKHNHTREQVVKFVDQQKKSEKDDMVNFLNTYDYQFMIRSLITQYKNYLETPPPIMNDLENKLHAMITIFNSYDIVKNSALSWKKIYFSVLKNLNCEISWKPRNFCSYKLDQYNKIKLLIDKFNKWYKEYKKIRHSKNQQDAKKSDIIKYLINIFVELQNVINSTEIFEKSAKTPNITDDSKNIIFLANSVYYETHNPPKLPDSPDSPDSPNSPKQKPSNRLLQGIGHIRRLLPHSKQAPQSARQGGNPKYKSTRTTVCILYKKRKYKRTVYTKDMKKTKYCKIDGKNILLSKLKVI